MSLTPDELLSLHELGDDLRRTDPCVFRAFVTGKPPKSRWSVWCTVYVFGSVLMLMFGVLAGVSLASVLMWLGLVTVGSAIVRAQDRAGIN
jgi:hypothetical protein